jgi:hypothetical protein
MAEVDDKQLTNKKWWCSTRKSKEGQRIRSVGGKEFKNF